MIFTHYITYLSFQLNSTLSLWDFFRLDWNLLMTSIPSALMFLHNDFGVVFTMDIRMVIWFEFRNCRIEELSPDNYSLPMSSVTNQVLVENWTGYSYIWQVCDYNCNCEPTFYQSPQRQALICKDRRIGLHTMLAKVRLIFLCNCWYFTKCKHILQKLLSCKRGGKVYGVGGECTVGDCQYTLQFN